MIDRITKNEERLNSVLNSINELQKSLDSFNNNIKNIKLLNKYYGSKNWFNDKEAYENGKITNVNAGVLSEDAIWNMLDDVNYLIEDMKKTIDTYNSKK